jgi:hypothetical protein
MDFNAANFLRIDLDSLDQEVSTIEGRAGWISALFSEDEIPLSRPKRLLREPEVVEKEGDFLIHPQKGKIWKILRWEETEGQGGNSREYYRVVVVEQGRSSSGGVRPRASAYRERQLWVFSSQHQPGFFLFGYFE